MRMYLVLAALIWLLAASAAPARDIFVNNVSGDDRRAGTLPEPRGTLGPCLTIAKALRVARPSDRIVIANTGQPYRESITLQAARHSGTSAYPFHIVGNGATLDGSVTLADADWEYVGNETFRTRPPYLSYQQLFLDDQPVTRVIVSASQPVRLEPLQWCFLEGWLYFRPESGKLPQSYHLSCCGATVGITLYEVRDVVLEDLIVRGFALDGVNCHDNVWRTNLEKLSCVHNGRSGISIGGASRVRVEGCTATGNGEAQFRMEGYCIVDLVDNGFDATSAPAIDQQGGEILPSE